MHALLGGGLEAVLVVDGSPDRSYTLLKERLAHATFPAQLICLSRNFGSFAAIRQGLAAAGGPYFAVMAADLQEPAAFALEAFRLLSEEPVDVAVGVRTGRADPILSRLSSRAFWAAYRVFVQREVPAGGVDVFGCNTPVRDALLAMPESNTSLVGLLFWLGFRRAEVPYERLARTAGRSAWTFGRKVRYLFDATFAFTDLPINALLGLGLIGITTALVVAALILVARATGGIRVPGYTPLALVSLFSLGVMLFGLGIVGTYVWRTFENSKGRPLYVPLSAESFRKER
jgi:glycosyltransferase involved in cell wall biosynthesis